MEHLLCWSNIKRPSEIDAQFNKNHTGYVHDDLFVSQKTLHYATNEFEFMFTKEFYQTAVVRMLLKVNCLFFS